VEPEAEPREVSEGFPTKPVGPEEKEGETDPWSWFGPGDTAKVSGGWIEVRSILGRESSASGFAAVGGKNIVEEGEIGAVVGGSCVEGGDVWKMDGVGPEERDEAVEV
jgi:hypothetical protein